jgi:hypothetical protein
MIGILLTVLVAALVYLILAAITGSAIVAIIGAILVLIAGIPSGGFGFGNRRGRRTAYPHTRNETVRPVPSPAGPAAFQSRRSDSNRRPAHYK